jgi:hypothetical protein
MPQAFQDCEAIISSFCVSESISRRLAVISSEAAASLFPLKRSFPLQLCNEIRQTSLSSEMTASRHEML